MAANKVTMKLDGMDALQRAITKAPEAAKNHAKDAVSKSTFAIFSRMQSRWTGGPYSVGGLRLGMRWSAPGLTGRITIDQGSFYWKYLEYGTVKMRAKPAIRPSTEEESGTFIKRMESFGQKLERDWSNGGGVL